MLIGLGYTCWVSWVDDIQSNRVTDSLCRLQRSLQLLHLQAPASLLVQVVRNHNCPQPRYGGNAGDVAWHWSQHSCSGWSLGIHQDVQNLLMSLVKMIIIKCIYCWFAQMYRCLYSITHVFCKFLSIIFNVLNFSLCIRLLVCVLEHVLHVFSPSQIPCNMLGEIKRFWFWLINIRRKRF